MVFATDNVGDFHIPVIDNHTEVIVKVFDGFETMPEAELKALYDSLGLAMTFKDFHSSVGRAPDC